jgi:hypothetical protein
MAQQLVETEEQEPHDWTNQGTTWTTEIIDQTLDETIRDENFNDYQDWHARVTSTLREIWDKRILPAQEFMDEIYSTLVSHVLHKSQKLKKS